MILVALADAALAALAGLYLWALAAFLHTPVIRPIQRWLRRRWRKPLISCPWCFGFWASVLLVGLLQWGRWDWVHTPLAILAAAALVGVIGGTWTPGFDDEDEG